MIVGKYLNHLWQIWPSTFTAKDVSTQRLNTYFKEHGLDHSYVNPPRRLWFKVSIGHQVRARVFYHWQYMASSSSTPAPHYEQHALIQDNLSVRALRLPKVYDGYTRILGKGHRLSMAHHWYKTAIFLCIATRSSPQVLLGLAQCICSYSLKKNKKYLWSMRQDAL